MRNSRKFTWLPVLILTWSLCGSVVAFDQTNETIMYRDWPIHENGSSVMDLPQVRSILKKFEEADGMSIEIRYPGGDAGRQWAVSVAGWLVSFGIPVGYMELLPGSGGPDQLVLTLIDRRT